MSVSLPLIPQPQHSAHHVPGTQSRFMKGDKMRTLKETKSPRIIMPLPHLNPGSGQTGTPGSCWHCLPPTPHICPHLSLKDRLTQELTAQVSGFQACLVG